MLSTRMGAIQTSATLEVAAVAARLRDQGVDVVDLGPGEPDFPTPAHVRAAAHAAIDQGYTKYTPNAGATETKRAVLDRYRQDYGVDYQESEVIVTAGGKQALFNAMLAIFGPGDEVVTHAPGWPTIPEQIKLAEATPVVTRTRSEEGFALEADAFIAKVTPRTKGFVVNSPCNPTGALMPEAEMDRLAAFAAGRGLWIIVDLCYERLIYEAVPHNLARVLGERMRDRTVLACSASKAYAMTGWRCGWALAPAPVVKAMGTIQSHSTSNACSITQRAVVAALRGPQESVAEMLAEYRTRRDAVWSWLTADPRIRCLKPAGAFYLLLDIHDVLADTGVRTSAEFAERLVHEANVTVTPGEAFDAPGCLRISYATSIERLREGTDRIHAFIRRLEQKAPNRSALSAT